MNTTLVPIVEHSNEVRLVGRVAAEPVVVLLPSGDEIVVARLIVERPRPPAGRGSRRSVDTVDCTSWGAAQRRAVRVWNAGDTVEVTGALRRRFWRTAAGAGQNRFEIEVETAKRLTRRPPEAPKSKKKRRLRAVGAEVAHQ